MTRDPTGSVRNDRDAEVAVLRFFEAESRAHPGIRGPEFDEILARRIYTPARIRKLKAAFAWVKATARSFILRQPLEVFSRTEKRVLLERIRRLVLELPQPASIYADEPDLLTKTGVFYDHGENGVLRIRVGGAYLLAADSWFNLLFTFSHELAHSIDPCELRASGQEPRAYRGLAACFVRSGILTAPRGRLECSGQDQLSETFADWMAVQLQTEALMKYATEFDPSQLRQAIVNSVRDLCDQDDSFLEPDLTQHPSPKVRIARIFGSNPKVQEILGCSPQVGAPAYCSLEAWVESP